MRNDDIKNVRDLKPFDERTYEGISLNQLATYTIDLLTKKGFPITFETLTVALFKMFPKKFCLYGFEEYPDAARVNRSLLQLRPKYRNWALGDTKKGYVLTSQGREIAEITMLPVLGSR